MALWAWANSAGYITDEAGLSDYPHWEAFAAKIAVRPATIKALQLRERHVFKSELDDVAKQAMFPQNYAK